MLRDRVITAVFLIAGFLAALFFAPAKMWAALIALVAGAAAWEWCALMRVADARRVVFVLLTIALCALPALGAMGDSRLFPTFVHGAGLAFWVLVVPFWLARGWRVGVAAGLLTGWLVIVPTALALVELRAIDALLLLAVMGLVWVADIAAYFTGRRFGRVKLAPSISPGKTREGAYGALLAVFVCGMMLYGLAGPDARAFPSLLVAIFLPVFAVLSIIGDLFESLLKRQSGLKDSGSLLPGHGGVLDRIDSLTSTMPLVALIALWAGW